MTLEEVIIELTKDTCCEKVPIDECVKVRCSECEYRSYIEFKDILPVLLETKKELAVYKKALELACSADGMFWESEYNEYLQKAREEE